MSIYACVNLKLREKTMKLINSFHINDNVNTNKRKNNTQVRCKSLMSMPKIFFNSLIRFYSNLLIEYMYIYPYHI